PAALPARHERPPSDGFLRESWRKTFESSAGGGPMRQAVWTGTISFGLVSIPVKIYPATEPKDVRFHLYDRRSGKRVHYERVTKDIDAPAFEPEPYSDDESEEPPEPRIADDIGRAVPAAQHVEREDVVRGFELPTGDLVTVTD